MYPISPRFATSLLFIITASLSVPWLLHGSGHATPVRPFSVSKPEVEQGRRITTWPQEVQAAIREGVVLFGMTVDEVRLAWGKTKCEVASNYRGQETDALGYRITRIAGEVIPVMDCGQARIFLYFRDGILIGSEPQQEN